MKYLKDFSELITENKTEALRKKYVSLLSDKFDIDLQKANVLFDDLSEMEDPTLNKVYMQWILNNSIKKFKTYEEISIFIDEDLYKWIEYLKIYHKVKSRLNDDQKNIQILSIDKLTDIVLQFKDKEDEIGTKNEVLDKKYKIVENEEYLVYLFKTATQDDFKFYQLVSTNTEWCTRPSYKKFKNYIDRTPLFVFINKNNRENKYQLNEQSGQFKDNRDKEINQKLKISLIKIISDYLPDDFAMVIKINSFFGFIKDPLLGLIDKWGNTIAKGFKEIFLFSEGFASVQFHENSWGFIDKSGNILAKGFTLTNGFREGFAFVALQKTSSGYIDTKGNMYEQDQKTPINKNDPRLKGIEFHSGKSIK